MRRWGCTIDTCDGDNTCVYLPSQSVCDDGDPCTIPCAKMESAKLLEARIVMM